MCNKLLTLFIIFGLYTSSFAIDFSKDIKPILEERCISCHGEQKDKGDIRLHTHSELIKSKAVSDKGVEDSRLIQLISLPEDHDDVMPPKGAPLTKDQISLFKTWINEGTKWPKGLVLRDRSKEPKSAEPKMTAKNEAFKKLAPIINQYCIECHNADKQKGDFRIDNMDQDLVYGIHAQRWYEVLDVLNLGDMPPKKAKQPNDHERRALIETLTIELDKAKKAKKGQVTTVMRRLNNEQYNNTLKDLLHVDFDFAKDLPEDGISPEGFKNNGATLGMSTMQMEYYLANARKAMDKAIIEGPPEVMKFHVDFGHFINPTLKEKITMGPGSRVIPTEHYKITAPIPVRSYGFTHRKLKDKFVFNEGYIGNGTIKGRKEFLGYHHAVYPEIDNFKGKIIPEGIIISPRGDLQLGKAGQRGPSSHMKLVVRDFPRSGPVTIRIKASQAPDSLILKSTSLAAINSSIPHIKDLKSTPSYLPSTNLEKPQFILKAKLDIKDDGFYQIDAQLVSELDGKLNIHIGDQLLEGIRIKKGAANLVTPIALAELKSGLTTIKITSKTKTEIAAFALTKLNGNEDKLKSLKKSIKKRQGSALQFSKGTAAKFSNKTNSFKAPALTFTSGEARAIKEGEFNVPVPTNHTAKKNFVVEKDGLYQIDLLLAKKLNKPVSLKINNSKIANLDLSKASEKISSSCLVKLRKGTSLLTIVSKEAEVSIKALYASKVTELKVIKDFQEYQASQFSYLRTFIGNRRDDGQEYQLLPQTLKVDAAFGQPRTYEFTAHMDDFPLPAHDPKNMNFLANLLHIGFWNTPWKSKGNPSILVHSIEFESNASKSWPPKAHKAILIDSQRGNEREYARTVLKNFLPKAYRRQISNEVLDRHVSFFDSLRPHKHSFESTIKEVLAISLSSPQFLYINEPEGTKSKTLTDDELASRLSYFIWNTMPDEELREAAANKTLKRDINVHLKRMLNDPKAYQLSKNFVNQWLDIDRLDRVVIDRKYSGGYQKDIKNSYKEETYAYFNHVLQANNSIEDLIDSDYAVVNWRLASFYSLPAVNSLSFKAVPVRKENNRGGILTNGSILTALSTGKHSSPIKRGVWLARKIVDSPPPKPPPNVPELDEENPALAKLSMKKQ
ncbi:MAG: DUF1592 domain-containing protein, partial [Lentisphaeraceae bacterium]|nr:DUF1592 domain-containing protein [Lentisphaeraceae bacterium]